MLEGTATSRHPRSAAAAAAEAACRHACAPCSPSRCPPHLATSPAGSPHAGSGHRRARGWRPAWSPGILGRSRPECLAFCLQAGLQALRSAGRTSDGPQAPRRCAGRQRSAGAAARRRQVGPFVTGSAAIDHRYRFQCSKPPLSPCKATAGGPAGPAAMLGVGAAARAAWTQTSNGFASLKGSPR